ncbi:MAG: adhesin transport system membrane fusion protein [Hyphomicrobiaceae bacterium]|jgi:adhesin transport system membrane fusion protein
MSTRDELGFAQNVKAALEESTFAPAWTHLLCVSMFIVLGLAWANYAVLEEATVGIGKVISSQHLQVVQTPEGGVVSEIVVQEGKTVKAGDLLMRIDATISRSQLGELGQRRSAFVAEMTRLTAEAEGRRELVFDAGLKERVPKVVGAQVRAFQARLNKLDSQLQLLEKVTRQRVHELAEFEARHARIVASLKPLTKELQLTRNLAKRGIVSEVELLRLNRQRAEMRGDRMVLEASIPRAQAAIEEAEKRRENAWAIFRSEARDRLSQVRGELAVIDETLRAARLRVARTDIRSPVDGVINKLAVTTIGAVKRAGETVAEIVPLGGALLIETQVRPQDVAFIHRGQSASVKLTAYDYLVYGALKGTVERIGADTLSDAQGQPYYRVIVRTEKAYLESGNEHLPAIPGMVASVDIQTGSKTVLEYLLKPIRRVRNEALRER